MISSYFPGRIRLRSGAFKDEALLLKAQELLRSIPALAAALKSIQTNLATGSVLIEYDPEKFSLEQGQKAQSLAKALLALEAAAKKFDGSDEGRQKIFALLDDLGPRLASAFA